MRGERTLTLFALNRHLEEALDITVSARGFGDLTLERAHTLRDDDLQAINTEKDPDRVRPGPLEGIEVRGGEIAATLPKASWSVLRFTTAR